MNNIDYYIMGGTALGAVRHGGFIPWDDDLDIFMTKDQYDRFKQVFDRQNSEKFVLQEWRSVPEYLGYSKVRMNGTTFIEHNLSNRKDLHHGIFVDIMILHKAPIAPHLQKILFLKSRFITIHSLNQRGWIPKTSLQKLIFRVAKLIPECMANGIVRWCYKSIYKQDAVEDNYVWSYFLTKARFSQGIFPKDMFQTPIDIPFEDTKLLGSTDIEEYLSIRYGNYLMLPGEDERKKAVHAEVYDVNKDYTGYM